MDIKEIQNLIKFVARSGAAEVNLETEDFKINIKTDAAYNYGSSAQQQMPQVISMPQMPAQQQQQQPQTQTQQQPSESEAKSATGGSDADDSRYITIKSPMIGTFYRRPSPDKEVYINVGDEIKPGSVVCVIEAMKLFNEIESEVSGKVVKILVDDQSPVEYDQPLILIDPS